MDTSELDKLVKWLMDGARSSPNPNRFLSEMCTMLLSNVI